MVQINQNYQKLAAGYLFPEIARRVKIFQQEHPQAKIIRLGIGDVVLPLVPAIVGAMKEAVEEMGTPQGFHGYGPEQGYDFLREAIAAQDYQARGANIQAKEIFISDGSKCDSGNIQEIFSPYAKIAVTDPVYPVYVDTNVMAGRTGSYLESGHYENILYLPATEENNFCPEPSQGKVDLVYLCSPNNPTGATMTRSQLEQWVNYAKTNQAVLLFDAAYEAFITDPNLPHSIYEIPGAQEVAIEFRSLSKTAGFTGTRCAWTVVPEALQAQDAQGKAVSLHSLWNRRHCTKFNGVSYPVQKGAAACFTQEGKRQIQEQISYYLANAQLIRQGLGQIGLKVFGGINAPYVWAQTPEGLDSWNFFDQLLTKANIVVTPGSGFGPSGQGYFRLSAFGRRENVLEAIERIQKLKI